MTKKDMWKENVRYYRELIDKYKFDQEPMVDLINRLDKEGLCQLFYPSNSHEALGLSLFDNYIDRCDNPMIYITYIPKTNSFSIYYQNGQGKTVFEDNSIDKLATYHFEKIRNWLKVTTT